jgi:transposase-like protein
MAMNAEVRRMRLRDGLSISEIARRTSLSRDTIKAWLRRTLLMAVPTHGLGAVLVAVELVLESGRPSAEHVLNVLARLTDGPAPLSVVTALTVATAPLADPHRYDRLHEEKVTRS